jgi:methylated-DNA-protein-cysteine methyltransferase-like protein
MGDQKLYERIYEVVCQVPAGRVATYGQIAAVVGPPCEARTVGYAMAAPGRYPASRAVPWHRVINAQGGISTKGDRQRRLLEGEGVIFDANGRTDLKRFGWEGPDPDWAQAHGFRILHSVDDPDMPPQLTLL